MRTRSILVVDDEATIRELLHHYLTGAGYEVHVASSAPSALKLLQERSVHVAIVDLFMPEQDGFEILKVLRQSYPEIKVLVMSGYGEHYLQMSGRLGGDAAIGKPFSREELLAKLQGLLAG